NNNNNNNNDNINDNDNKVLTKIIKESVYNDILNNVGYPCQIIENRLYLGDGRQATNPYVMHLLQITHVVNVTRLVPNTFSKEELSNLSQDQSFSLFQPLLLYYFLYQCPIQYCKIPLEDTVQADIHSFFQTAADFIDNALSNTKNRVLVHCQMGISRSTTIILAYLIQCRRLTLKVCFQLHQLKFYSVLLFFFCNIINVSMCTYNVQKDAFEHCVNCRKVISPNEGFLEKLVMLERRVFNGKDTLADLQALGYYPLLRLGTTKKDRTSRLYP
ncbi:dual specificity phosphatase 1, partial [Reticulomyxa filosa]